MNERISKAALPLTVLVHEGPMARAYLAGLEHQGLRVERILKLSYNLHPVSAKPLGPLLWGNLRRSYAEFIQERALFYWPRRIFKTYPQWISDISHIVTTELGFPQSVALSSLGNRPLSDFADQVETVWIDNLKHAALQERLQSLAPGTFLYTGGGIMPSPAFEIPGIRILHCHPGILPDIKGADGLLWSTLLRGCPGASCFYMAPGLDTGDVICTREFNALKLPKPENPIDELMLYRTLYSFVDPLYRAATLLDAISGKKPLHNLKARRQDENAGVTFHFMADKLRQPVLQSIFSLPS